jgi:hypothetical protein
MIRPWLLSVGLILATITTACGDDDAAPATPKQRPLTVAMEKVCNSLTYAGALYTDPPMRQLSQASRWLRENLNHSEVRAMLAGLRQRTPSDRVETIRAMARKAGLKKCGLAAMLERSLHAKPSRADAIRMVGVLARAAKARGQARVRVLVGGCAEVLSCARECLFPLKQVAKAPEKAWPQLLAHCESFPEGSRDAGPLADQLEAWISARLSASADALADLVPAKDKEAYRSARAAAGL